MPELDGYETLAAMKADDETRHIPVLIVSGCRRARQRRALHRARRVGLSAKADQASILAARINASLAAKRLHDGWKRAQAEPPPSSGRRRSSAASSRRRWPPWCPHRRASSCWPDIGARSRRSSATCAASPPSPSRPIPRSCSACCASTTRDGRSDRRARRNARALRRRRRDGLLQRPDRAAPITSNARCGWPWRCASGSPASPAAGGSAAMSWASGSGSRSGYATLGRIGFDGRYDYGAIGNVVILASRLSAARPQAGQILLSPRAHAASRSWWSRSRLVS